MEIKAFKMVTELFINFTRSCNLNCSYCFEEHKNGTFISEDVLDALIEIIKNKNDLKYFYLFGGEPFLALKQANYFVDALDKIHQETGRDFHIAVISNGTIYNEEVKKLIIKIKKNLNFYFTLSLDGARDIHDKNRKFKSGEGTYDLALKNTMQLKKDFPDVRVEYHCVVNKDVANNFYKNAKSLFRHNFFISGTFKFLSNTKIDNGYTVEDYENLYRDIMKLNEEGYSLKYLGERLDGLLYGVDYRYMNCYTEKDICTNCTNILSIDVNGDVYPCNHYMSVDINKVKKFSIYNLLTEKENDFPIKTILDICNADECRACGYKYTCYICSASVDINGIDGFKYCCNENKKIHKAMENIKFIIK